MFDADSRARERRPRRCGAGAALPGHHNALNALAAIAAASEAGIADDVIRSAMAGFSGVKRRFQLPGTLNGVAIYDDTAIIPSEIAAVLKAARAGARGRVIAVVEPHRYTRVRDLFDDFAACFKDADSVVVTPMYRPANCRSRASITCSCRSHRYDGTSQCCLPSTASGTSYRC